jgi:hypothetical protein
VGPPAAAAAATGAAAASSGGQQQHEGQAFEYVLYTKEEFEAANKCSVSHRAGRQCLV